VNADTTLETVALDTPNNVAVCVTDAPVKRAPSICPLQIGKIFHFFDSFTQAVTNKLAGALQSLNKRKKKISVSN
jgi:hypothetical protein